MTTPLRPSLRLTLFAATAILSALSCNQAKAQSSTWLNSGSGSWFVNTNWSDTTIPYQYQGALITNGGTAVIASGSTGEAYGLQLGNSGTGSVVNYGVLRIDNGTLGQSAGDYGSYLGVSGSLTAGSLTAGWSGRGDVNLTAGSYAQINFLTIGTGTTGQGSVALSGTSQLDASYFSVGVAGSGTLSLQDRSRLTGDTLIIAGNNLGAATVNRSTVTTSYELSVGYSGTAVGSLAITNSGTVSGGNVFIGRSGTAQGTVTVSGSGSRLSTGGLNLAQSGSTSGSLTVQSGGILSTTDTFLAGDAAGLGSVVVKDAGSSWTNANSLVIGSSGTGSVAIQNGGTGSSGWATLGNNANSAGTLAVTGNGSNFAVGGQLSVGNLGTGTLNISNGGVVSSGSTFVGGNNSSVVIDGAGSQLIADTFATGVTGTGSYTNTVTVQNGGRLTSNGVSLSYGPVTNATVTGTGSVWTATNNFYIAIFNDASLSVTNGGVVEAGFIRKGDPSAPDGHAGTISLDGGTLRALQDSALISNFADGAVSIGAGGGTIDTNGHSIAIASNLGGSGLLSQTGGGEMRFTANQNNDVSFAVRSGTFTVDGSQASIVSSGSLVIGHAAGDKALAELIFEADVQYSGVVVGNGLNSSGTLNVRNESTLSTYEYGYPSGSIIVGNYGTGRLDISEQSEVLTSSIVLGSGSTGLGVLAVDNSTINAAVTVGALGSGSMSLTNGAKVTGGGTVGTGSNTYSGVLVDGAGSVWSSSNSGITVGLNGTTVSNVVNGGALENLSVVGYLAGQSVLRVAGNGSRIVGNSYVSVGVTGTGALIVEDGATFTGSTVLFGNSQGSYGSLSIYTNAASATADTMIFGASGSSQLYLAFGGSLRTTSAYLASGSTGRADALVDGDGTVWDSELIYVGTSGTANLSIARNAVVNVGSGTGVLYLASASSSVGTLNIGSTEGEALAAAGTLNAAAIQGGAGTGLVKFNHTGSISFAPALTGNLKVQNRAGTTLLSGSNNYSGGTLVNGGTLAIANNNAVGTGGVMVETGGVFLVKQGFSATNRITLNGGLYQHQIAANGDLAGSIVASTDLGLYGPTSAAILAGTASSAATLSASFSASGDGVLSAVLHLNGVPVVSGQRTDIFVLEFSMSNIEPGSYLAWLNGEDEWVNAVLGNFGNNADADQQGFDGSFAEFQAVPGNGTDLSTYIGAWGFTDTSVWAVLNHNSDFGVVPEPSVVALVGLGCAAMLFRRRVRP